MKKALLLALALVGTTACTHLGQPLAASQGSATTQNFSAQVVNSAAVPGAPEPDAVLTAAAISRYQTDDVKDGKSESAPILTLNLAPLK
jgi:hypothetical protein